MATEPVKIIRSCEDLDPAWLAQALGSGSVASFTSEKIGTGQMSESHRVTLTYEDSEDGGPETIIIKLAASNPTSRATGIGLGIYEREIRFYRELAPRIGGPLAPCAFARFDEGGGWFTLVLEDAAPAVTGDQIAGCTVEQARLAMRELARLHAPVFADRELSASDWLNRPSPVNQALVSQLLPGFLERYGDAVSAEHRALCERFVASLDAWLAERPGPLGLVHGDFRLDNLLFGEPGSRRALTVVDWQTVAWGSAMADAAYFLGGGLQLEERRVHEQELFEEYLDTLRSHGVKEASPDDCRVAYRQQSLGGVLMAIVASMIVERTERGDDMFMAMLARHSQHALDLSADQLLGQPGAARAAPLPVEPRDEARHTPGPEQLWNESWYFDAITADGSLGAYVRIGLYPNLNACWYTAFVCGPGRPTIAVVDFAAPLPQDGRLRTQTEALRAEHRCEVPLERFAVELEATGEAHEDQSAPLRGERGRPQPVALDLRWETDGVPYAYSLTTRYEIPCRVSGTIRVGEETIVLSEAVGQRDHSWGTRDWWSMDWVWSAGHLSDGTHLHAVELRLAEGPTLGVGYVQPADGGLYELDRVTASEQAGEDGLITAARLSLDPPGLEAEIEPLAFGPLRLVAPDGRVSHFPRAMCRIRCDDGRSGLAWVEWNRNQPNGP
jgi:thiamine kinase-like enzyme